MRGPVTKVSENPKKKKKQLLGRARNEKKEPRVRSSLTLEDDDGGCKFDEIPEAKD